MIKINLLKPGIIVYDTPELGGIIDIEKLALALSRAKDWKQASIEEREKMRRARQGKKQK